MKLRWKRETMLIEKAVKPKRPSKRERTRALLLDATVEVIAAQGIEANTIVDIANRANVANGTFYLHFKDKQEAIEAAIFQVAKQIAHQVHEADKTIPQVARRAGRTMWDLIQSILAKPVWAQALVNAYGAMPELRKHLGKDVLSNIREGVSKGNFHAKGSSFEIECILAIHMMTVRMRLAGLGGTELNRDCVELVLKMLGVTPKKAQTIAAEIAREKIRATAGK